MNVSTKFPVEIGPIHFIGIGGIGMSGIAEILINPRLFCSRFGFEGNRNYITVRENGCVNKNWP